MDWSYNPFCVSFVGFSGDPTQRSNDRTCLGIAHSRSTTLTPEDRRLHLRHRHRKCHYQQLINRKGVYATHVQAQRT